MSGTVTVNVNFVNKPPVAIPVSLNSFASYNGSYTIVTLTGNDYEDGTNLKNASISALPIYGDLYDVGNGGMIGTSKLNIGSTTTGMQVAYQLKTNFWNYGVRESSIMFLFNN